MPTTRRKRERSARIRVTPEVMQAIREERAGTRHPQASSARYLLGIRPWEWGDGPLSIPEDEHPELCADLRATGLFDGDENDAD